MSAHKAHAADVFAALGDPTRLALVATLSRGERRSLASLASNTRLTRQAVAKHLRVLQGAGLVRHSRDGRESRYALEAAPLDEARDYLASVSAHWDDALERLKAMVEDSSS